MIFEDLLRMNSQNFKPNRRELLLKKGGIVTIIVGGESFSGGSIHLLLAKLNYIRNVYKGACKKIIFRFLNVFVPMDKLTYIIFESIIYMLCKKYNYEVLVYMKGFDLSINTSGFKSSLLRMFVAREIGQDDFQRKFVWLLDKTHFRRMVNHDDSEEQSRLMYDIKHFVANLGVNREDSTRIAEIVAELADNACEHAQSDCLIDIDIADDWFRKTGDEDGIYYSVNVSVLNFSDKLIWDNLKEKVVTRNYKESPRYEKLEKAYSFHKEKFDDVYDEDYFFIISTFQNEISGRPNQTETGGKGLTELLTEIGANKNDGYLLSGNKVVCFPTELIQYDKDGWVGFNAQKDFFSSIPDREVLCKSETFLPGTAYNLTLIYRR